MSPDSGLVTVSGHVSVDETIRRLEGILEARGAKIFAVIDHSGEAEKIGLRMPNTKLVIFGNPKGGTPLMLAAPSIAIDLPLKLLVAEDAEGRVSITYNTAEFLRQRHELSSNMTEALALVTKLADEIAR